jgi:hypothetical protein
MDSAAGKRVNENTIAANTRKELNSPKCWSGGIGAVRNDKKPAAVVSEVSTTGCYISTIAATTTSVDEISDCSGCSRILS